MNINRLFVLLYATSVYTLTIVNPNVSLAGKVQTIAQANNVCFSNEKNWKSLISFRPSSNIQRKLKNKGWYVHPIENAKGQINLDYYPVKISRLPQRQSPDELLRYIRLNLNKFINQKLANFEPYNQSYLRQWKSQNPLSSVIHIDIFLKSLNVDDGSVIVSASNNRSWIFSTIWTNSDFRHPVSGNRKFGFIRKNNSYIFYTKGADRTTTLLDSIASTQVFGGGEALWTSFQQSLVKFVNQQGGSAEIVPAISKRCDWEQIKQRYHNPTTPWIMIT
ncbi:MAG: hypothetical protein AAF349_07315 [Cyanobacteria bacterium P01_A01_bin.68]